MHFWKPQLQLGSVDFHHFSLNWTLCTFVPWCAGNGWLNFYLAASRTLGCNVLGEWAELLPQKLSSQKLLYDVNLVK